MTESSDSAVKLPPPRVAPGVATQCLPNGAVIVAIDGDEGIEDLKLIVPPEEVRQRAEQFRSYAVGLEELAARFRLASSWLEESDAVVRRGGKDSAE